MAADQVDVENRQKQAKLPCLVADSAAFIKNVDLQNLTDKVYTIGDVINEIRDATTKQRLAVLPYEIIFREPSAESIKNVTEFSKKTGDFKNLSAVDLRVLGLTYQLEKEFCNKEHIKDEPDKKVQIVDKKKMLGKEMAGFFFEKNKSSKNQEMHEERESNSEVCEDLKEDTTVENMDVIENELSSIKNAGEQVNEENEDQMEVEKEDPNEEETEQNEDDGGWITPSNIKSMKQKMGYDDEKEIEYDKIKCACLTTDFAMQNVLIQMGLHVLSVNGMLIRQARNYIQKCYGCYKETTDMERLFCAACGNKTLLKVSVTIGEDGTIQYHYPKRRRNFNIRGTKFSIPAPKGGRQSHDILLVEDQKTAHNRLPKKRDQINPLDPDYVTRSSPFSVNDTNSRAFALGHHVKHTQSRNPNATKKKKSGKKK